MKAIPTQNLVAASLACVLALATTLAHATDALPSWNDGKAKQSIVDFVAKVTKEGSPDFVPPRAHCHVRQRRNALGRAANVFPISLRR